jgi:rhodanese-related sulfurtransferase
LACRKYEAIFIHEVADAHGLIQNGVMNKSIPSNISPKELHRLLLKDPSEFVLVDVREDQELAIAPFPGQVLHLPLSKASLWIKELPVKLMNTKSIVVICHSGVRSWDFATWLIEQGWGHEVWNLEGGIDAWSANVDRTVPRY